MVPAAGAILGVHRIVAPLGAGGMGEVYRATDTKLGRDVALKLLPEAFAADPDRLARFEREAKVLASLNHPNIAHLYGFETAALPDGACAHLLVMELVEGEDLAARLKRGALPVDEAIAIARQVAEALEEAHEKGIVHRDLKPGNVKVTPDGKVKVLDFGLAKAWGEDADSRGASAPAVSQSPTLTHTGTAAGVILGTAAYMSPEQARGKAVDKRADIWAFGVLVYEMLTGKRLFVGETVTDVLASVVKEPIGWAALPASTPAHVRRLLQRCLERDPKKRLRDVGEGRIALDGHAPEETPVRTPASRTLARVSVGLGLALVITAAGLAWTMLERPPARVARVRKLSLLPPAKSSFDAFAISPDGRRLAFTAATEGRVGLWVRALDATGSVALPATEGATLPFWSPDGRAIGFFAGGKLRRVDVEGGIVSTLCDVGVPTGGSWNRDNVILFSRLGGSGFSRVSASGGEVASVMRVDPQRQETDYANPFFLPDGRHFLYSVFSARKDSRGVYVGSLDGKLRQRIVSDNTNAVYAADGRGREFLVFGRGGALVSQGFDSRTLRLRGDTVPIAPQVAMGQDTVAVGRRLVTASEDGVLVFDPSPDRQGSRLLWVDRGGRPAGAPIPLERPSMVRLSPDGRRCAVALLDPESGNQDIWLSDATGGNPTRFTFDPGNDSMPVWSPDGRRLVWASNREGVYQLYQKAASGSGEDALFLKSDQYKFPTDWSRDGRTILYRQMDPKTGFDLWTLPVGPAAGELKPVPFLRTEANETAAVFSPDGRWVAYASDESGRYEVYVRGFPSGEGTRQVSSGGGNAPLWRGDGSELYYQASDGTLMAAAVERGPGFATRPPVALFAFRPSGPLTTPFYAPAPDGQRFLLSAIVDAAPGAPLTVVVDWTAAIEK